MDYGTFNWHWLKPTLSLIWHWGYGILYQQVLGFLLNWNICSFYTSGELDCWEKYT